MEIFKIMEVQEVSMEVQEESVIVKEPQQETEQINGP